MAFTFLKQRRRRNLKGKPFPAAWRSIITRNVPIIRRLPPADQIELLGHVQVFLAEKLFEGCGGLEVTDEIRVTIAEYQSWSGVMSREFAALRVADETGIPTVLDIYGAENPAEFFAVVTEAFFERPSALHAKHPELYAEFARFFRQDPIRYSAET